MNKKSSHKTLAKPVVEDKAPGAIKNINIQMPSMSNIAGITTESQVNTVKVSKISAEDLENDRLFREHLSPEEYEKLTAIFKETEKLKESQVNYKEQIDDLKQHLSGSTEFLNRMKKQIGNLKFSYQHKLLELNRKLDTGECLEKVVPEIESKEQFEQYVEEMTRKIDGLRHRFQNQLNKKTTVASDYQKAFAAVVNMLEQIESGSYHSQKVGDSCELDEQSCEPSAGTKIKELEAADEKLDETKIGGKKLDEKIDKQMSSENV